MIFWIVTSLAWFVLGYVAARYGPRHLRRVTTRKWENVLGEVWFPARGKWMLCNVHSPLDPERQFYKVYSAWSSCKMSWIGKHKKARDDDRHGPCVLMLTAGS